MCKFVKEQEAEILKSVLKIKVVLSKFVVSVYFFLNTIDWDFKETFIWW